MVKIGDKLKRFKGKSEDYPRHPLDLYFFPGYDLQDMVGNWIVTDVKEGKWVAFKAFGNLYAPIEACEFETDLTQACEDPYCNACGGFKKHKLMCPRTRAVTK